MVWPPRPEPKIQYTFRQTQWYAFRRRATTF